MCRIWKFAPPLPYNKAKQYSARPNWAILLKSVWLSSLWWENISQGTSYLAGSKSRTRRNSWSIAGRAEWDSIWTKGPNYAPGASTTPTYKSQICVPHTQSSCTLRVSYCCSVHGCMGICTVQGLWVYFTSLLKRLLPRIPGNSSFLRMTAPLWKTTVLMFGRSHDNLI